MGLKAERFEMANTEAVAKRMPQGDRRPIGVFDSGVGGLSVLRALEEKLPLENYIYFGDTARAPYGGRKPEEIRRFNLEIGGWLLERGCKMLVVACNTSTVWGMAALKEMASVPVYGLMDAVLEGTLEGNLVSRTDTLQMGTMAGTLAAGEGADGVQASDGEIWPVGFVATEGTVASGS
jgi:glutamate racemase